VEPFELTAVVHLVRPTGHTAHDLEELRAGISAADARSLFLHTVQALLRQPASEDPPADDLSAWVGGVVQDRETAERLAFAAQAGSASPDALRGALLHVLESVPEKARRTRDAPEGGDFVFLSADSVRVPTGALAADPEELLELLARADASVWFQHLYEQPWFADGGRTISSWLRECGGGRLAALLEECAAEALPLAALRRRVLGRWRRGQIGRRVARAAGRTEEERREAGREAVAGLVRRLQRGGDAP
jgi:hypothetical protein